MSLREISFSGERNNDGDDNHGRNKAMFFWCNFRFILLLFFAFTCLDFAFKVLINEIGKKIGCRRRTLYDILEVSVYVCVSVCLFVCLSVCLCLFLSLSVSLSLPPPSHIRKKEEETSQQPQQQHTVHLSLSSQVYGVCHQPTRQLTPDIDAVTDHCAIGVPELPGQTKKREIPLADNLFPVTW